MQGVSNMFETPGAVASDRVQFNADDHKSLDQRRERNQLQCREQNQLQGLTGQNQLDANEISYSAANSACEKGAPCSRHCCYWAVQGNISWTRT